MLGCRRIAPWLGALALGAVACNVGSGAEPGADGGGSATDAQTDGIPDGFALVGHSRELRGVWVATVANIDWPDRQGASAAEQQAELAAIVDACADAHLNAIM